MSLALKCAALTDAAARGDVDMLRTICRIKPSEDASQAIKRKCAAHASIVCVERAQGRLSSGTAPRWRGLFLPRGFERREVVKRGAVVDAHALLAETAQNDVDDCRAATSWLCVLGAEQPRREELGLGAVLDACAETEGCQRWVLGVVDEEPGDVSAEVEDEEPVQETRI